MIRLTLFLLTVLQINIFSAWYTQQSGVTTTLNSVCFVSLTNGFAAGDNGVILKTVDKGASWQRMNSGTSNHLYCIKFLNQQTGFACGDNIILKTINGGLTWQTYTEGIISSLKSLSIINENLVFTAGYGGKIYKSVNGGNSWSISAQIENSGFTSVFFLNSNTGYVAGLAGNYYKSIDGGLTWNSKPTDATKNFYSVQFVNENIGFITGGWVSSTVMKSNDGGESWNNLFGGAAGVRLFSGSFIDEFNGYVCGRYGTIMKTEDGGSSWQTENSGVNVSLNSIHFINQQTAYAVGENGKIISTVSVIGINQIGTNIPNEFSLEQNYPNPFNPATKIKFSIAVPGFVTIALYNIMGEEIKNLVSQHMNPGIYETELNVSELPSGTYFYTLNAGEFHQTRKMVLVK